MGNGTTHVVTKLSRAMRRNIAVIEADLDRAATGDRGAIHRVRVASRRLRAALPVVVGSSHARVSALARDVRKVTRALADVRELDVVRKVLRGLPAEATCSPSTLARLDAGCERARERAMVAARRRLARIEPNRVRARVERAAGRVDRSPARALTTELVGEIRRRIHAFQDALRAAGVVYAVEPLHEVRLAAKKVRYALELAGDLFGDEPGRTVRRLKTFQGTLGDLHDAQMAQQYVRSVAAGTSSTARAAELDELDRELELECRNLHARVLRAHPRVEESLRRVLALSAASGLPRRATHVARMKGRRAERAVAVGE